MTFTMSDTNTSESSPKYTDDEILEPHNIFIVMKYFGMAVTLPAFIYASHRIVKRDTFKDFVLFNAITAIVLRFMILEVCSYNWTKNMRNIYELQIMYWSIMYYLISTFQMWVHSFFYVLYVEYVSIITNREHPLFRNRLFFILLNWVIPFILVLIFCISFLFASSNNDLINFHIITYALFIFVPNTVLNVIMCLKFVTAVRHDVHSNELNSLNQGIRYFIVISIFICNNMTVLHVLIFFKNSLIVNVIRTFLLEYLITIILDMYILIRDHKLIRNHLHRIYTYISAYCPPMLNLGHPQRAPTTPYLDLNQRAPTIPDLGGLQPSTSIGNNQQNLQCRDRTNERRDNKKCR